MTGTLCRRVLGVHKDCRVIDLFACRLQKGGGFYTEERLLAVVGKEAFRRPFSCYCGSLQKSEPPSRAESSQRCPWWGLGLLLGPRVCTLLTLPAQLLTWGLVYQGGHS